MATAARNTLMVQLSNGAVGRRCVHRCNLPLGSAEVVVCRGVAGGAVCKFKVLLNARLVSCRGHHAEGAEILSQ